MPLKNLNTRVLTYPPGAAGPGGGGGGGGVVIGGFIVASFRTWNWKTGTPFFATQIASIALSVGQANSIVKSGTVAFVGDGDHLNTLYTINISNPNAPVSLGQLILPNACVPTVGIVALTVIGTNVFSLSLPNSLGGNLSAIDASTPSSPTLTKQYNLTSAFGVGIDDPTAIVSHDSLIYVQGVSQAFAGQPEIFSIYDCTDPAALVQKGTINFGTNTSPGANGGCALVINHPHVYSLIGGDATTTPASLRVIDVSDPVHPAVVGGPLTIGTFTDTPVNLILDGTTVYVLSGTPLTANQKVFVVNVSNSTIPTIIRTIAVNDPLALPGLASGFVSNGAISMTSGVRQQASGAGTNLLVYKTTGQFVGSKVISSAGGAGTAIAPVV